MDAFDKILKEYSWKFPKGYPDINDEADKALLFSIVEGYIKEETDKVLSIEEILEEMSKAGIKDAYSVNGIKKIYDSYNDTQKLIFSQNFRKYSLSKQNIEKITEIYKDFFDVKASQGMGKGEVQALLGLKGAGSGGTETKDILIDGDVVEVKELSGKEFGLGKDGYVNGTNYEKNYNLLKSIFTTDLLPVFEGVFTEEEVESSELAIAYMNKFSSNNNSGGFIKLLKKVTGFISKKINEVSSEDINFIDVNNKTKFTIDPDDVSKFKAGEEISLKLGDSIDAAKDSIIKLKKHPWIVDPNNIDKNLNSIFERFLQGIDYTIFYNIVSPNTKGQLLSSDEIKNNFIPHRIAQNVLKAKYSPQPKED